MSTTRNGQPFGQRGFTLLELLISITLLGLILVLLFGGLRLGVRSWDATQQQVDKLNTVRAVESFLRREMSLTHPYRWKKPTGPQLAFLGERNKISFITQLPPRIGEGGLYAVSLELEKTGSGGRMIWKYLPVHSKMQDFSALAQVPEMVLAVYELSGTGDIWLSYFGRDSENSAPRWSEQWANDVRLPLLIKIQVKLDNGLEWPDFVVAPMLTSGSGQ